MTEKLHFRVVKSLSLPGLGILLLPDSASEALADVALHTSLVLALRYPGGPAATAVASVEEISWLGVAATRALLLTEQPAAPVPAGTEVWWDGAQAGW